MFVFKSIGSHTTFSYRKKYIMVGRYQVSPQKPKCNWTRGLIIVYNPNTLHITVFIAKLLPESKGAFEEHIIPIAVKAPFIQFAFSLPISPKPPRWAGGERCDIWTPPTTGSWMGGGRTTEEPTVLAELRRVAGECETPRGAVALRISSTLSGSKLKLRVSLKKQQQTWNYQRDTSNVTRFCCRLEMVVLVVCFLIWRVG